MAWYRSPCSAPSSGYKKQSLRARPHFTSAADSQREAAELGFTLYILVDLLYCNGWLVEAGSARCSYAGSSHTTQYCKCK